MIAEMMIERLIRDDALAGATQQVLELRKVGDDAWDLLLAGCELLAMGEGADEGSGLARPHICLFLC